MIDAHLFFIKIASILRQNRARELNLILRVSFNTAKKVPVMTGPLNLKSRFLPTSKYKPVVIMVVILAALLFLIKITLTILLDISFDPVYWCISAV